MIRDEAVTFYIELLSSKSEQFDNVANDLDSAERQLIQLWSPCFNVSQNIIPTPIPDFYRPVNAKLRGARSLNKLIRQAERVVRSEEAENWV